MDEIPMSPDSLRILGLDGGPSAPPPPPPPPSTPTPGASVMSPDSIRILGLGRNSSAHPLQGPPNPNAQAIQASRQRITELTQEVQAAKGNPYIDDVSPYQNALLAEQGKLAILQGGAMSAQQKAAASNPATPGVWYSGPSGVPNAGYSPAIPGAKPWTQGSNGVWSRVVPGPNGPQRQFHSPPHEVGVVDVLSPQGADALNQGITDVLMPTSTPSILIKGQLPPAQAKQVAATPQGNTPSIPVQADRIALKSALGFINPVSIASFEGQAITDPASIVSGAVQSVGKTVGLIPSSSWQDWLQNATGTALGAAMIGHGVVSVAKGALGAPTDYPGFAAPAADLAPNNGVTSAPVAEGPLDTDSTTYSVSLIPLAHAPDRPVGAFNTDKAAIHAAQTGAIQHGQTVMVGWNPYRVDIAPGDVADSGASATPLPPLGTPTVKAGPTYEPLTYVADKPAGFFDDKASADEAWRANQLSNGATVFVDHNPYRVTGEPLEPPTPTAGTATLPSRELAGQPASVADPNDGPASSEVRSTSPATPMFQPLAGTPDEPMSFDAVEDAIDAWHAGDIRDGSIVYIDGSLHRVLDPLAESSKTVDAQTVGSSSGAPGQQYPNQPTGSIAGAIAKSPSANDPFERFDQIVSGVSAFRAQNPIDINLEGLPAARLGAGVGKLMDATTMRVGSEVYANENETYGAASILKKHVTVDGDTVRFQFPGKGRTPWEVKVTDADFARLITELMRLPGDRLFQFENEKGALKPFTAENARKYLRQFGIRPKDFRQYHGTEMAARLFGEAEDPVGHEHADGVITRVAVQVSRHLGNTRRTALKSYIHPAEVERYRSRMP